MALFSRLRTGFAFAFRSARVLRDYPRLAVLPAVGGLAGLVYVAALWGVVLVADPSPRQPVLLVTLLCVYVGSTFVASSSTAALMFCARQAFRGDEPRLGDGLRAVGRNLGPLLAWSVISAIVGLVVRAIGANDSLPAEILAAVFSVAWSVLTYFVVPVIVFEDAGLLGTFSRSKETVAETWGESLGAAGAVDLVTFALAALGAIPGVVLLFVFHAGALAVGLLVVGILLAGLVGKTLTGIAKTALYLYATEDDAPAYFDGIDFGDGGDGSGGNSGLRSRLPGSGGIV